jgi:transcriptional regulator with XRE-family HTH domain
MRLDELLTDEAALTELGRRLEHHRLARNWTQDELAFEAQLGRATVQRLERGQPVQSVSLIKVLRTLGLLGALDAAVPESIELPIAELERERRQRRGRKRARRGGRRDVRAEPPAQEGSWRWGEESG